MDEVRQTLREASGPPDGACMYCEVPRANHIDHFDPRTRAPLRTFDWPNLVWSCATCDTTHKGARFVREADGVLPVNPRVDRPEDHLRTTPEGYIDPISTRGEWTRDLLGLDEASLPRIRRVRWLALVRTIPVYAEARIVGATRRADELEEDIRWGGFPSILRDIVHDASGPYAEPLGLTAIRAALAARPEICTWCI